MDMSTIAGMKVEELKNYLRLLGLKVSGQKEELIARVLVASENDVQIVKTAEEVQQEIAKEYQKKLVIGAEETIPDPTTVKEGWIDEQAGVMFWPTTLYPDIFDFLAFHPNELASSDLSDYKQSKAYSYYAQGWLYPLEYHDVDNNCRYCVIRGSCRPSQRINDVPHKLWICLSKESGQIMQTHCTCMAGMSQACNHVAAGLFRIEAAIRLGLNNPSCTSKPFEWLPNNKAVQPVKIKDLKLGRSDFGRRSRLRDEINSSPEKSFNPMRHCKHTNSTFGCCQCSDGSLQ